MLKVQKTADRQKGSDPYARDHEAPQVQGEGGQTPPPVEDLQDTPPVLETTTQPEGVPTPEPEAPVNLTPQDSVPETPPQAPETEEGITEPETPAQPQFSESDVYNYLSEQLGRDVTSLDDLKPETPPSIDPQLQSVSEWMERTGRPMEDWVKYQKDFDSMSDTDVAREHLRHKYPNTSKENIEREMKKFTVTEDDLDSEASAKKWELEKYAQNARAELNQNKSQFDTPVDVSNRLTPEAKEQLTLGQKYQQQIAQTEQANREYKQALDSAINSTQNIPINLSDDLKLNYNLSPEAKRDLPKMMEEMSHWKNPDGSWNHQAVVNDAVKVNHFDQIVKMAYEQGINAGKDDLLSETSNSTIDSQTTSRNVPETPSGDKGYIEGRDEIMNYRQNSSNFKFGRKNK